MKKSFCINHSKPKIFYIKVNNDIAERVPKESRPAVTVAGNARMITAGC
jgi:hypothetical protein